jgi:nucleoside-diphosphate-sugar epimerase
MRALVTGAAGFIGSHLSERLIDAGHEVTALDAVTDYYDADVKRTNLKAVAERGARTVEADLRTADLPVLVAGTDVVFHLAGQPGIRASWGERFSDYLSHNVLATQRLLEASAAAGAGRFVFASSSSVYGDAERHPTPEDAPPAPVSPYGVTKAAAEHLVGAYHRATGLPVVSLRYFTVYGPRQRPDMAFNRFMHAAIEGRPIEVYGDGEQGRDVTFVADAVAATVAAAGSAAAVGRTINVGGGSVVTVNECLRLLREVSGRELEVVHLEAQVGDARRTSADLTLARDVLGYRPGTGLEDGLRAEWEWVAEMAGAR